jgi:hypothetical protein
MVNIGQSCSIRKLRSTRAETIRLKAFQRMRVKLERFEDRRLGARTRGASQRAKIKIALAVSRLGVRWPLGKGGERGPKEEPAKSTESLAHPRS